jgi:hypothetical protein
MSDPRRTTLAAIAGAIVLVFLAVSLASAATVNVTVPGTANPYLAGMPPGTTCCAGGTTGVPDVAGPGGQSPVQVGMDVSPGTVLTFSATGGVAFAPGRAADPPDGGIINELNTFGLDGTPSSDGIAGIKAPQDALVGLFLDNNDPRSTAAPDRLDFSAAGIGTNFSALSPGLKQPFFIGDGRTSTGAVQQFVAPPGATRFFLGTVDGNQWNSNSGELNVTVNSSAPAAASLAAALLPLSRSVRVNSPATAFATMIPAGSAAGVNCTIALPPGQVPAGTAFSVNTTNPATNAITGGAIAASVPAGQPQSFVISITPPQAFGPADVQFQFKCDNIAAAQTINGVNTLTLSASSTPVPDIIALAATNPNNGIVAIANVGASAAFAIATFNVGASAPITVSPEVRAGLPVALTVCRTDPSSGACIQGQGPAQAITVQINTNETPTFAVFATATGGVPFDPANNRIFVRFRDSGGTIRGATSVAVRTP